MSRMGLTARQKAGLDFITSFIAEHDWSPSYREIGDSLGITSTSNVHFLVKRLVERGYLRHLPGRSRCLEVVGREATSAPSAAGATRSVRVPSYSETKEAYLLLDNLLAETLCGVPCKVTITVTPVQPAIGGQP